MNNITSENNNIPYMIEKYGVVIEVNPAFCEITDFNSLDMIGKTTQNVWSSLLRASKSIDLIDDKMQVFIFTRTLDVKCVNVQKMKYYESNQIKYFINEVSNLRFEETNSYLLQLVKSEFCSIAIYSLPDMILLKANQKYLNLLQHPFNVKNNSIGRRITEIISNWEDSSIEQYTKEAIDKNRTVKSKEYKQKGYKNNITYWEAIITPISCCREMKFVVFNIFDITDLINNRQGLVESQRRLIDAEVEKREALENAMKLKDEFLYLITHEFKTPISVINSALQTMDLLFKDQMPEKVNKFLSTIKKNTKRQLRLVNNLLDITRINSGEITLNYQNYDIVFITQSIVNSVYSFAQQKNIEIIFKSKFKKKYMPIDEEKFERILLNLLSNALKFTENDKSICINIYAGRYKDKKMICISVKDEGIGIPKDKQEYIFKEFGQVNTSLSRHTEGAGMGLYLVRLLVNAMDGYITLKSTEGKGSNFIVMFPIERETYENDEIAACIEDKNQFLDRNKRIIQSTTIEFSDIYF